MPNKKIPIYFGQKIPLDCQMYNFFHKNKKVYLKASYETPSIEKTQLLYDRHVMRALHMRE